MFDAGGTGATLAPEHDGARPPLGRLLVERGFISEEQLEYTLSESDRTGLPLGQVLIGLSYVTASTIAQALAAPHDDVQKTEYGFDATGKGAWTAPPVSPEPALAEAAVAPLSPLEIAVPEPVVAIELLEAQTRIAELVELAGASARQETRNVRQDAEIARHEAAMALQEAEATRRDLEASREDTEAARAGANAVRRDLEAVHAELVTVRGELEAARNEAGAAWQEVAAMRQAVAENEACALKLQQLQNELAMSTENLRNAYARLHQFEIAQALQQQPTPRVQPATPMQMAPPPAHPAPAPQASPVTRQS